jgi:hypothetical protein
MSIPTVQFTFLQPYDETGSITNSQYTIDNASAALQYKSDLSALAPVADDITKISTNPRQRPSSQLLDAAIGPASSSSYLSSGDVATGIFDADGLYTLAPQEYVDGSVTYATKFSLKMNWIRGLGANKSTFAYYVVPPGQPAPTSHLEIQRLYVLVPNTNNADLNNKQGLQFSACDHNRQPTTYKDHFGRDNSLVFEALTPGTVVELTDIQVPVDGGSPSAAPRYGFVLINKCWSEVIDKSVGDLNAIPWDQIIENCRFSQSSLNAYTGYAGLVPDYTNFTGVAYNASDRSTYGAAAHFAAKRVLDTSGFTVPNGNNKYYDYLLVEDLALNDPNCDWDYNDIMFALKFMVIETDIQAV